MLPRFLPLDPRHSFSKVNLRAMNELEEPKAEYLSGSSCGKRARNVHLIRNLIGTETLSSVEFHSSARFCRRSRLAMNLSER